MDSVNTLCELGIDANLLSNPTRSTALHMAANTGASAETIAALVQQCGIHPDGALMNGDTSALYLAASNGHAVTVRALLRMGASPHFAMPEQSFLRSQELILSHQQGNVETVLVNAQPGHYVVQYMRTLG